MGRQIFERSWRRDKEVVRASILYNKVAVLRINVSAKKALRLYISLQIDDTQL